MVYEEKEWLFITEAKDMTVTGAELSEEQKQIILLNLEMEVNSIKAQTQEGKMENIQGFPVDTVVPFVALFYIVQMAETFEVTDDSKFIELGGSLQKFGVLSDKQKKLLKPITGDFHKEVNNQGKDALFQIMIDDNFFNSLTATLVSIDRTFSLREVVKS